jgi:CDP-glucose 4,6-dehydratase
MGLTFWRDRRVLLTGHTGFKGGWLALLLDRLGARVSGYALAPPSGPSLFETAGVGRHLRSRLGNINDLPALQAFAAEAEPEIIFHLAAQALVLPSYQAPLDTLTTNVLGTAHVLELARQLPGLKAVVVVTSDKVYENREWSWGYREIDHLGGHDPYSASKACAELVTAAYRRSFLAAAGVAAGTARAGNVIGGGDWSAHRLVPDFIRAVLRGEPFIVRNPASVRPWQHVLEPLEGYLLLAQALASGEPGADQAWNFGPAVEASRPVADLATDLTRLWGGAAAWKHQGADQAHEAGRLGLDAAKARARLGWTPRLGYEEGLRWTVEWYKAFARQADMEAFTIAQVDAFRELSS